MIGVASRIEHGVRLTRSGYVVGVYDEHEQRNLITDLAHGGIRAVPVARFVSAWTLTSSPLLIRRTSREDS